MIRERSATDVYQEMYPEFATKENVTRNITFQVTEQCTLRCTYCYQSHEAHSCDNKKMSKETAKACVDYLYKLWDENQEGAFINQDTKMLVLDFIGGEPMLMTDIIDYIATYFWEQAILRKCIWAETFMISISTNGTLHFTPEVQKFLRKWKSHLSYGISVDGDEEIHNSCRIYPDGHGSWKDAVKANEDFIKHFGNESKSSKSTICKETIPLINRIIGYFIDNGYTQINSNYAYEPEYTDEDAKELYIQMKELAKKQLEKYGEIEISLFGDVYFKPKREDDTQTWCGGGGKMLAFDTEGKAFPCVRYMSSSLGKDIEPLICGDCYKGIYNTEETIKLKNNLESITRRTESNDECFYCPVADGCSECMAWNYQQAKKLDVRSTNICPLHKSRSLANVLYYNELYKKLNENKYFHRYLKDDESLKYISQEELDYLNELEEFNKSKENSICVNYANIDEDRKQYYPNVRW